MRPSLDELDEFPRCIKCRERSAHRTEMVDLTAALTSEALRPTSPVYAHRDGECSL